MGSIAYSTWSNGSMFVSKFNASYFVKTVIDYKKAFEAADVSGTTPTAEGQPFNQAFSAYTSKLSDNSTDFYSINMPWPSTATFVSINGESYLCISPDNSSLVIRPNILKVKSALSSIGQEDVEWKLSSDCSASGNPFSLGATDKMVPPSILIAMSSTYSAQDY